MPVQVEPLERRVVGRAVERDELGVDREVGRWLVVVVDREIPDDRVHVAEAFDERPVPDGCGRDDPRQEHDVTAHQRSHERAVASTIGCSTWRRPSSPRNGFHRSAGDPRNSRYDVAGFVLALLPDIGAPPGRSHRSRFFPSLNRMKTTIA
jgi:hypothetical protein